MINIEYMEAITETLDILEHMRKDDVDKIPSRFIEFLKENASKTYKPHLDYTKKIENMQLKQKTRVILAIIYRNFWCNYDEKKEFDGILKENEIKYQNKLREIYHPDKLFDKSLKNMEKTEINAAVSIEKKTSIYKMLINKIKNIFRLK